MYSFRCTRKLLKSMRLEPVVEPPPSTTRLGDWYANEFTVQRTRVVLCVSSKTLLPLLIPRAGADLPGRLRLALGKVLGAIGVVQELVDEELRQMADVAIAPTASRSILSSMTEFKLMAETFTVTESSLFAVSLALGATVCGPIQFRHPAEVALESMSRQR